MLDEASLRRLAEMGVDVYVPRQAATPAGGSARIEPSDRVARVANVSTGARVVLVSTVPAAIGARGVQADVMRAFRYAGIASESAAVDAADSIAGASGLVLFGEALARQVGGTLSAQRQRDIGWVVTGDAHSLARDAGAKRVLWSELKRLVKVVQAAAAAATTR